MRRGGNADDRGQQIEAAAARRNLNIPALDFERQLFDQFEHSGSSG